MELISYATILALAVGFSYRTNPINNTATFYGLATACFLALSLIVRFGGFDADIITYASEMHSSGMQLYYLREPVVWLGHRVLLQLLGSEAAVFVVTDMLCFAAVAAAHRNLRLPQYALFALIVFFPFIMGMQNIYRQWVGACLALYAFSIADRHLVRSMLVFGLALASHNVAALFFPIVFSRARREISLSLFVAGLVAAPLALYFGAGSKSSANTGLSLELLHLAVIVAVSLFICVPKGKEWVRSELVACAYAIFLMICSIIILSSAGAERVSLSILMLLFPSLVLAVDIRFSGMPLMRALFSVAGFAPVLLFGVRRFIL